MDAALLLAALAGRAGDRVDLLAYDRRTRLQVSGGSGPSLLPRLVDAIATLEPELIETDYRGLVATVCHGCASAPWSCCSSPWTAPRWRRACSRRCRP